MHATYCIIGAGPTGLGAGYGLARLGEDDFLILEASPRIGGHAASIKDEAGFTWDLSPLPMSGRYKTFTRILDDLLGTDAPEHSREAWVRAGGSWVPQPFARNLHYLPPQQRMECLRGLLPSGDTVPAPEHLGEWLALWYGPHMAELFFEPLATKRWGTPCSELSWGWAERRMDDADLEAVLESVVLERDDTGHGPHAVFRTPAFGGTAELFRRMAKRLRDRILIGQEAVLIDSVGKVVHVQGSEPVTYDHLLTTMPLDRLVADVLDGPPEPVRRAAESLARVSALSVGVGVRGGRKGTAHWMEFPQDNCPFFRVSHLHNFAQSRTAGPEARALLAEVAWTGERPDSVDEMVGGVLDGLENVALLSAGRRGDVVSLWHVERALAAPLPDLAREAALRTIIPYLETAEVYSRGLFGGWRHEVADLDQCVMQGIEWARRMVHGEVETIYEP